jgi:hypothetical protein
MKICTKCKVEKELSEYYKQKTGKYGFTSKCIKCHKKYNKENKEKISNQTKQYREQNKEKISNQRKIYREQNKEKIKYRNKQKNKIYRINNREKLLERSKKYRQENKDKILNYQKKYRQENKDKILQSNQTYYKNNKEKIREKLRIYEKERKKTDQLFKFKHNIRINISNSFKRGTNQFSKKAKTETILGCTIEEFIVYIQNKLTEGMTIDNHGEWHLDHIIPLASADTEEDVIKLCHYTNYQPLWAADNIRKSNKIITDVV